MRNVALHFWHLTDLPKALAGNSYFVWHFGQAIVGIGPGLSGLDWFDWELDGKQEQRQRRTEYLNSSVLGPH